MPTKNNAPYIRRYVSRRQAAGDRSTTIKLPRAAIEALNRARGQQPKAAFVRGLVTDFIDWFWAGGIEHLPPRLSRAQIGAAGDEYIAFWLEDEVLRDLEVIRGETKRASLIRFIIYRGIAWRESGADQPFTEYLERRQEAGLGVQESKGQPKGAAIGLNEIRQSGIDP